MFYTIFEYVVYFHLALPVVAMAWQAFAPESVQPIAIYLGSIRMGLNFLSKHFGHFVSWLSLLMVLVTFVVVVLRYAFGISFIWMQESVIYMHGLLFTLAAGYTLLIDGHVRVDIIYREATPKTKALVDFLGTYFFLLPVMYLILDVALPYIQFSWDVREGSKETSGIQAVYLLKSVIVIFAWLLILQGFATIVRAALTLMGYDVESTDEHADMVI